MCSEQTSNYLALKIKTVDESFETTINCRCNVADLKRQIAQERDYGGKHLRLIYQGKILQNDTLLQSLNLSNRSCLHLAVSDFASTSQDIEHQRPLALEPRSTGSGLRVLFVRDVELSSTDLPLDDFNSNLYPTQDLLLGVIVGLFLGVISIIWLWDQRTPLRFKLGILAGAGLNIMYTMLKMQAEQYIA